MTLFDIALKNIKRNFNNYYVYFFSMISSIIIFFAFTSIQYNEQVIARTSHSLRISSSMKGAALVIGIFAAVFIWYSTSFFLKKRKKELGLLSLMGLKKSQIAKMLFYENIIMGILALCIGIFIGGLFTKSITMILLKFMGLYTGVKFSLVPNAIIHTIILFSIIFLITSIYGYTIIYRFKVIELFRAEKKAEKEPKYSLFTSVLSIILIGLGYFISYNILNFDFNESIVPQILGFFSKIILTLLFTIIGTYFLFSSLLILIIKLSKKNKIRYYKGLNFISTSQLLYRIKDNAKTLAIIAVLCASTLSAFGAVYSIYYNNEKNVTSLIPFTYAYIDQEKYINEQVENTIKRYPEHKILSSLDIDALHFAASIPDSDFLPSLMIQYDQKTNKLKDVVTIVSLSNYNKLADILGFKIINIENPNDVYMIDPSYYFFKKLLDFEDLKGKRLEISTYEGKKDFKIASILSDNLMNENLLEGLPIIVRDDIYEDLFRTGDFFKIKALITTNPKTSANLTNHLETILPLKAHFSSFYRNYKDSLAYNGLLLFIGIFMGLIFLMATGSIIYFRQLTEANEDKQRYRILKKIGVTKKEIKNNIAKQMLFIFLLPLIVGIMHSSMALLDFAKLLSTNLIIPVLLSYGAYILIYLGFYFLTVNSYNKIINSDE